MSVTPMSGHVSRAGLSILTNVGLGGLACATPDEYVRRATQLATGPGRLEALRAGLRQRMERSPLRDECGYARAVEAAYRAFSPPAAVCGQALLPVADRPHRPDWKRPEGLSQMTQQPQAFRS